MRGKSPSSFEIAPGRTKHEFVDVKLIYAEKASALKPEPPGFVAAQPDNAEGSATGANATQPRESIPAKIVATAAEVVSRLPSPGSPSGLSASQAEPSARALARQKFSSPSRQLRFNSQDLPDRERHARKCCICSHPDRDAIEGEFIRWDCPRRIAKDYQIADRASFYRHAHATGLYARRRREFARVLENILECVEHSTLEETADVIIRASRVYARLDENGNWVEPRRTHVILTGPAPPQFAGNPELADSFELQPRLEHQEISVTSAKRRDRTSKRKRALIATADPARLLRPGRGGEMTLGMPSESTATKGVRQLPSKSVKKSAPRSKAKKRLIATPPKLENGPTS
jgi:hypothetical protein